MSVATTASSVCSVNTMAIKVGGSSKEREGAAPLMNHVHRSMLLDTEFMMVQLAAAAQSR